MPTSFLVWEMPAIVSLGQSDLTLIVWAVFAGVLSGLVAALPTVLLLRCVSQRHAPQVVVGLICSLLGVLMLQAATLVVHLLKPSATLSYGAAAALTLLATILVATLVTWRKIGQ